MPYPLTLNPVSVAAGVRAINAPTPSKVSVPTRIAIPPPPWAAFRTAVVRLVFAPLPLPVAATRVWGGQLSTGVSGAGAGGPMVGQIWPRSAPAAPPGPPGPRGASWFTGHGPPTPRPTGAVAGDFYLDLDTGNIWAL